MGHTNLFRRNAVYYYRSRVPNDLLETFGKSEVKFSLGTKDYKEAIKKIRIEAARVETLFEEHRQEIARTSSLELDDLTPNQLKHIRDVYYQYLLDEDEETRLEGFYREDAPLPNNPVPSFEEYKEDNTTWQNFHRVDYAQGQTDFFFDDEALEVISWSNVCLNITEGSIAHKKVARVLQEATLRAQDSIQSRNEGQIVDTPAVPLSGLSDSPVESDAPLLSEVMEEWIKDRERSSWKPKTSKGHRVAVELLMGMCGDKPFNQYTKADIRAYKDALLTIPPNWRRHRVFKGMNLQQAAHKAALLGMPPMTAKNAKKNLQFTGNLWRWLSSNYDDLGQNPFDGITIKVSSDSRSERHPFTLEELNTIFSSPLYASGAHKEDDAAKYWTPLIALYSGARLGEILQLHVSDIKKDEGIYYFDINDDEGKTLKTSLSNRSIPIHHRLVGAGFLEFISKRETQGTTRVFPEVTLCADGTYTAAFSKYFSRFLMSLEVKHSKNSFHSFRHTFEDACRENDVPKAIMDALQGHSEKGMSGRYGAGYSLQS